MTSDWKAHKLCIKGQNNVWQNSTQKTAILATLVPLKTEVNMCFGRVSCSCSVTGTRSSCSITGTRSIVVKRRELHLILNSCRTPVYLNKYKYHKWDRVAHHFSFLCCIIMCLYVLSSVLWCPLRIQHKTMFGSSLLPVVCRRANVLIFTFNICVCLRIVVLQHLLHCVYFRFVYPMLPVSLYCPLVIATSIFSHVYLQN
jgi:hypothetical protein